jgi:Neutral/alkaline non-lysosomal ceramidase, N-terminal
VTRCLVVTIATAASLLLLRPGSRLMADTSSSALTVGFGETDITPQIGPKPVYIAGYGQNRRATGVHDRLKARAFVLGDGKHKVAFVCLDLVGLFNTNAENVRSRLAGFDYVVVSSTHVHEGPDTLGLWGSGPLVSGVDPQYLKFVEEQAANAVRAADAAARPAVARIGTARAPELLHDGREPYIKHDELVALKFSETPGAAPSGIVVEWNCHPETVDSKSTEITSDYVATTVAKLRERHHCPVVYLTGTVGGLMTTLHVEVKGADGKVLPEGSVAKMVRYGELLADVADRAVKDSQPIQLAPFQVRHRPLYLPLDNKLYVLARTVGVLDRPGFVWSGDTVKARPAKPEDGDKRLCLKSELAYLKLGDLEVAAIPGEIYPELVLGKVQDPPDPGADFPDAPIEPALYAQLTGKHRMIVGLANDEIGYIIPKRQWDEKPPYCYGRKSPQYGEMNSLGPDTAPLLCQAFRELVANKK